MTTARKSIADYDRPDIDPHDAAAKILAELGVPATAAELLRPVVADYLRHARRAEVAKIEGCTLTRRPWAGAEDLLSRIHAEQALGDLLPLLTQPFRVERTGEVTTWGNATVSQHRRRAETLRDQASALAAAAERHEQIAELLEQQGVETLAELLARGAA